jgi:hypothetical protein
MKGTRACLGKRLGIRRLFLHRPGDAVSEVGPRSRPPGHLPLLFHAVGGAQQGSAPRDLGGLDRKPNHGLSGYVDRQS